MFSQKCTGISQKIEQKIRLWKGLFQRSQQRESEARINGERSTEYTQKRKFGFFVESIVSDRQSYQLNAYFLYVLTDFLEGGYHRIFKDIVNKEKYIILNFLLVNDNAALYRIDYFMHESTVDWTTEIDHSSDVAKWRVTESNKYQQTGLETMNFL